MCFMNKYAHKTWVLKSLHKLNGRQHKLYPPTSGTAPSKNPTLFLPHERCVNPSYGVYDLANYEVQLKND